MNTIRMAVVLLLTLLGASCRPVPAEEGTIRPPSVAGAFYPAAPDQLTREVDGFLAAAPAPLSKAPPVRVLVVPHAGYVYSGAVAARAYRLIANQKISTVVLIGSSHRAAFPYAALWPAGAFRTPLGDIPIDADLTRRLLASGPHVMTSTAAHLDDHVLEVQLPFLQRALGDFKLVPIMLGTPDPATATAVGEAITAAAGPDTLIVASTDLSHYPTYTDACAADAKTIAAILTGDPDQLVRSLRTMEKMPPKNMSTFMCSEGAVLAAMTFAQRVGAHHTSLLQYANSGDTAGTHDRVVGYAAIAFSGSTPQAETSPTQENPMKPQAEFTPAERQELLNLARQTVETVTRTGKPPSYDGASPGLQRPRGAFVTLHQNGRLRGCIGHFDADQPVYQTVIAMAVAAATQDPRFPRVTPADLDSLTYEISVLSPLRKISDWRDIQLGTHGVQVSRGFRRGVFLPQVATETGWDLDTFMGELCSQKAGLPPNAWKDPKTDLYVFTAEIFSD